VQPKDKVAPRKTDTVQAKDKVAFRTGRTPVDIISCFTNSSWCSGLVNPVGKNSRLAVKGRVCSSILSRGKELQHRLPTYHLKRAEESIASYGIQPCIRYTLLQP
jgi:hypothetical protein